MHAQVHLVVSANDDSAEIRSFCRFLWGFLVGHFTRFGSTPTNLHTGLGAPRMQHSAQHTPYYNVAAPPCVQADACGGRGPANLHLQPGGGAHPGSNVARQHHSALALAWLALPRHGECAMRFFPIQTPLLL